MNFKKKKLEKELDNKTNENDKNIGKIKNSQRHCYTFSSSLASTLWSGCRGLNNYFNASNPVICYAENILLD
jgi:hypothetical protein